MIHQKTNYMKHTTKIIKDNDIIDICDENLPLNVGDVFHFRCKSTSVNSEKRFKEENPQIEKEVLEKIIKEIKDRACIVRKFLVIHIEMNYSKDHNLSISSPETRFVKIIRVQELDMGY